MLIYGRGNGARTIYGTPSFYDLDNPRSLLTINRTPFLTPDTGESSNATVTLTGISLVSSIGTETVTGTASVSITGTDITPATGNETVTGTASITAAGTDITSAQGDETVTGIANVAPTGTGLTGSTGIVVPVVVPTTTSSAVTGWGRRRWNTPSINVIGDTAWKPMQDHNRKAQADRVAVVESDEVIAANIGKVSIQTTSRASTAEVSEARTNVGCAIIAIDYTEKMRRQEKEVLEFLLAA